MRSVRKPAWMNILQSNGSTNWKKISELITRKNTVIDKVRLVITFFFGFCCLHSSLIAEAPLQRITLCSGTVFIKMGGRSPFWKTSNFAACGSSHSRRVRSTTYDYSLWPAALLCLRGRRPDGLNGKGGARIVEYPHVSAEAARRWDWPEYIARLNSMPPSTHRDWGRPLEAYLK